jgi:hypothetical protein
MSCIQRSWARSTAKDIAGFLDSSSRASLILWFLWCLGVVWQKAAPHIDYGCRVGALYAQGGFDWAVKHAFGPERYGPSGACPCQVPLDDGLGRRLCGQDTLLDD